MLHLPNKGLLRLLRARFWWYVRSICRHFSDLLGVVSRVVPGRRAVVVIHEEGPAGVRVYLDLPSERQRLAVVARHGRRLRLHAVHAAAARVLKHFPASGGRFKDSSK